MAKKCIGSRSFFHGTKAELNIGDLLEPQFLSNYQDKKSNHIYFTGTLNAAKWGAELARSSAKERIYIVEPLGDFENDPNVTDKGSLETRLAPTDPNRR